MCVCVRVCMRVCLCVCVVYMCGVCMWHTYMYLYVCVHGACVSVCALYVVVYCVVCGMCMCVGNEHGEEDVLVICCVHIISDRHKHCSWRYRWIGLLCLIPMTHTSVLRNGSWYDNHVPVPASLLRELPHKGIIYILPYKGMI